MQTDITESAQNRLSEILGMIPPRTWQFIVKTDPQWQHLNPLHSKFSRGAFSVFLMMTGLNAFQLKGMAETAYWAKLHELLSSCDSIPSIEVLTEYLAGFYQRERLYNSKLDRLSRFLRSSLAESLWKKSPQEISTMTQEIWRDLCAVMNQALHEKTICFAMKCLGVSLMMAGENDFHFEDIPIPVDSRVCKFTERLGLNYGEKTRKIQGFWQGVLSQICQSGPTINMIHLDSIVWQIAHLDRNDLEVYFEELGIGDTGRRLACLL